MAAPVATVPLRTLGSVFMAGIGGSYLYNNLDSTLSLLAALSQTTIHHLTRPGSPVSDETIRALTAHLAAIENAAASAAANAAGAALAAHQGGGGSPTSLAAIVTALGMLTKVVAGSTIIAASSYIAYKGNQGVESIAWVTRRTFKNAVEGLEAGVAKVSTSVSSAKEELARKIKDIEAQVLVALRTIEAKIEKEAQALRGDLVVIDGKVDDVQDSLIGMQEQLQDLKSRMLFANNGIYLLCKVAVTLSANNESDPSWQEIKKFAEEHLRTCTTDVIHLNSSSIPITTPTLGEKFPSIALESASATGLKGLLGEDNDATLLAKLNTVFKKRIDLAPVL